MKYRTIIAALLLATPVSAANFTTAAEVRPIVGAIKGSWIAVRPWDGQDLLYFTNLLSWRCGLSEISFRVNDEEMQVLNAEPCYENEGAPNALKVVETLPYVSFPPDSIQTIDVHITYDDGETEAAHFDRAAVQIN